MNANSSFASRFLAAIGAFALTASLMLGSFSADPQVQAFAGVIA